MKTATQKQPRSFFAKAMMIMTFIAAGFAANAQCSAGYTYTADPANDGDVAFANTSSGSIAYYYWDFGDGNYSSAVNPVHTYAATGTYTACLTVYDSVGMFDSTMGCYNTFCTTFSVINTGGSSGTSCNAVFMPYDSAGYGYFDNLSVGTGVTSAWDFGDGSSGTSSGTSDITHFYASPGTYYVCLTISNFLGTCIDSYCDSIVIGTGTSGACMGVVNANFTATDSLGTVYFSNTVSGSGPVYFWDFGDGSNSSVVGSTTHTYASPGTYLVCLTVYETGGGTDSCQYCSYVTAGSSTVPCSAYFAVVQDSTNLYNYFVYNYSTPGTSGTITSYLWDFGDGTTSTLAYPTHTYATTAPVTLCLTITTMSSGFVSCTATYCDSITPGMMMSGPFTVNVLAPTGVSEQEISSVVENYPNPFSDNTTISYTISKDARVAVSIVDLVGNQIAELENGNKAAGSYTLNWNAEGTSGGMYLLRLKVNNSVTTRKLVLNR